MSREILLSAEVAITVGEADELADEAGAVVWDAGLVLIGALRISTGARGEWLSTNRSP
jgi:hypothetical protein